jgi:hypothetical protein
MGMKSEELATIILYALGALTMWVFCFIGFKEAIKKKDKESFKSGFGWLFISFTPIVMVIPIIAFVAAIPYLIIEVIPSFIFKHFIDKKS